MLHNYMAEAKRDQNHVPVLLGYDDRISTTVMAHCDPITNYILIEIQPREDYTGVSVTEPAKRDQNHVPVMLSVTNDSNQNVVMVPAHPISKLPMIDFIEI